MVRSPEPLVIGLCHIDSPKLELVQLHLKPWPDLLKLDFLVRHACVRMMPERDEIIIIAEGNHTLAFLLGCRERVFENVCEALAKLGGHVVEDKMWVRLRDSAYCAVLAGDVVAHHAVA
eukprot:COSAG01_NODE_124_length_25180_cov_12.776112_2_plen_119_part_00